MRLLYFAWVKEKTGIAAEEIEPPAGVATVADLIAWLKSRGPEFEHAFARSEVIRAAIDQAMCGTMPASPARGRSPSSRRSPEAEVTHARHVIAGLDPAIQGNRHGACGTWMRLSRLVLGPAEPDPSAGHDVV
jgi:sulfur-carrier protein